MRKERRRQHDQNAPAALFSKREVNTIQYPILVVDRDEAVFAQEQAGWSQRAIELLRVDSMCEALTEISRRDFLFIAINADNISYLPMLHILRESAGAPIFIVTSDFKISDQVEALHNGAAVYAPFRANVEDNIMSALALVHSYEEQRKGSRKRAKVEIYQPLFVLPELWQVWCDDTLISLTKTEFNILYLLLTNRKRVLLCERIFEHVWGEGNPENPSKLVSNHINNLRHKLSLHPALPGFIKVVHGVGYKFDPD